MNSYLEKRLENAKTLLKQEKIFVYLLEDPTDIFYLTGVDLSRGTLCLYQDKAELYVDGRYYFAVKESVSHIEVFNSLKKDPYSDLKMTLSEERKVGFDPEKVVFSKYQALAKLGLKLEGLPNPLTKLRQTKDADEIACLEKSSKVLMNAMTYISGQFKEGMTELELSALLESKALLLGAEKASFRPIVAFGENAAIPHHKSSHKKLVSSNFVLIDAGFTVDGYASDMTRVFPFGNISGEHQKVYDACLASLKAVLKEVKAGVSFKTLDELARSVIEKHGFEPMPHSLGHGVGIELHEKPLINSRDSSLKLEENMVITIEPGIYIPKSVGIRLEEMILVTKTGYKNFYKNMPIC